MRCALGEAYGLGDAEGGGGGVVLYQDGVRADGVGAEDDEAEDDEVTEECVP